MPRRSRSALFLPLAAAILLCARISAAGEAAPETAEAARPPSAPADAGAWEESWSGKVAVVAVKGVIIGKPFSDMPRRVTDALDKADRDGARLVVLEIDSPGGEVGTCDTLSKRIFEAKTPVVALVLHKAVSGGAMLASAAGEIVMTRSARIGDIQPMQASITGAGGGMDDRTAEKIEVDIRTIMKVYAERFNRPTRVVEAMVSRKSSLYQVRFDGGKTEYFTDQELEVVEENIAKGRDARKIADTRLIKPDGKLLELSAAEAVEFGLASEIIDGAEAFYASRGVEPGEMVRPGVPEGEMSLSKLIPSADDLGLPLWVLVLLGVFLVVGVAGVVTEFQAPGAGIPIAVGIIGFVCFFSVLFMYDRGSPLGIGLFLVGMALLVVEIMILPGFGVAGVLGIVGILAGLLLAFTPDWNSEYMNRFMWEEVGSFTILLFFGLSAAIAVVWFVSKYGDRVPCLGRLFLTESLRGGVNPNPEAVVPRPAESARLEARSLLGRIGAAETPLRPAGKARLDSGELLDVVTDGTYVEAGRRVKVMEAAPNRILVVPDGQE